MGSWTESDERNGQDAAWGRAADYQKEVRPMLDVRRIVVRGGVDLVVVCEEQAQLVVAGPTIEAVQGVRSEFVGDALVIDATANGGAGQGSVVRSKDGSVVVSARGAGSIAVGGSLYIDGKAVHASGPYAVGGGVACIVRVAMSATPAIDVQGAAGVSLYGVDQAGLDLRVHGSGDIQAFGRVADLAVEVSGSGDIDVSELAAETARLAVSGSGDIHAHVTRSVSARVSGSGAVVVRGNPAEREHVVHGSGDIVFKKR